MKPIDIYNLKAQEVTSNLYGLQGFYFNHIPEVDISELDHDLNEKIVIKEHVYYSFDGRRIWQLSSVWFENKPVMILQNAGREGDDHSKRFVTNRSLYIEMVNYLKTLTFEQVDSISDLVDENAEVENLTYFYGHDLKDFYDEDFKPQYKVGDIIGIIVNNTFQITDKVKITNVYDNPYDCYRVETLGAIPTWHRLNKDLKIIR